MVIRIEEEGSPPEIYFINTAMRKISKKGGKGGRTGEWKRMEGDFKIIIIHCGESGRLPTMHSPSHKLETPTVARI